MDQLKDFLRQCVKYRFWIAFGVLLLLPMIGYFVGTGAIVQATTTREGEIKGANTEVGKYRSGTVVNNQYPPLAAQKKDVLTKDVDTTWRKLYANQAPLLRWPEDVEARFRKWGRKFPSDVDKGQVQATIIDYTISYPNFVSKVYKTFKPFNFDTGEGVVVAPDEKILLRPAAFSPDAPPELGKVWAEQERIWVVTALLDVIAKVNDKAKDWDGAIVKQINLIEVGSQLDQDQKSIAKNETLVPADALLPDGVTAPAPAAAPSANPMEKMMGMGGSSSAAATDEVYYIKTEGQQFKILPIKMTVLVEQAKLPDFLVALENSPMTIQLKEAEISKPLTPVTKPVYGEKSSFNMMGMGGSGGGMPGVNPNESAMAAMMRAQGGRGMTGGAAPPGGNNDAMMRMMMGGSGGAPAVVKKGTDVRGVNKADERKKREKEASKAKVETKKIDQYFNVIEVTVYGQARFYSAPPPLPEPPPSTAAPAPAAPAAPEAAPTETPKAEVPAKKDEAPKKDETPKPEASKTEAPAPKPEEPKADTPKSEAPKPEAPGPEGAKPESPKTDSASPKR